MKLLLVNYEYPPLGGGAATATRGLAAALRDLGAEVTVLTGRAGGSAALESPDGFSVHRVWTGRRRPDRCSLPEMAAFLLSALLHLPRLALRHRFDGAILFFGFPCGLLGLPLKHVFGVPYVVALRGGDVPGTEPGLNALHRFLQPVRRWIYRDAAAVTANSPGLRERSLAADPSPVRVIPNGVATPRLTSLSPQLAANLPILFVGRLAAQKNVAMLLEAFRFLPSSATLSLAGDGPLRGELEGLTTKLGIAPRVRFHGWVERDRMAAIYREASVLVLPSWYEGMSNVALEAMASGLPVIATAVEGTSELIEDGVTGLIVPPGDAAALAQAMNRLLADPPLRARLAAAARTRVERHFSWSASARDYLELFQTRHEG